MAIHSEAWIDEVGEEFSNPERWLEQLRSILLEAETIPAPEDPFVEDQLHNLRMEASSSLQELEMVLDEMPHKLSSMFDTLASVRARRKSSSGVPGISEAWDDAEVEGVWEVEDEGAYEE